MIQGHLEAIGGQVGSLAEAADTRAEKSEYRCICGCAKRSVAPIPRDIALNPAELRPYLMKLGLSERRVEVVLSAYGADFEGAYKRYRVADYHVNLPSTPFEKHGGHAGESTPSPHGVAQLFFSTQGGAPRLVRMSTPSAPAVTPSAMDPLDTKLFKGLKRKLEPSVFNHFKDLIYDTMGKWRSAERIFSAELDKAACRIQLDQSPGRQ